MAEQPQNSSRGKDDAAAEDGHPQAPKSTRQIRDQLAETDLEFVRVLEDLIATLIEKRVILLTDLPVAAQRKLSARAGLRDRLTSLESIVAEADDVMLP